MTHCHVFVEQCYFLVNGLALKKINIYMRAIIIVRFVTLQAILIGFLILILSSHANSTSIKSDEVVVFFPTIAYPVDDLWRLEIHGWIYEPQSEISFYLHRWLGKNKDKDEEQDSLFKKRTAAFFVDNERGKKITIHLAGKSILLKNKSAANGHFYDVLYLSATEIEKWRRGGDFIPFEAVSRDSRHFEGKIQLIDKQGISVISDIDDTIKISQVRDKRALLSNTFYRPFRAVANMAELYRRILQQKNVTFHYVSASPWQLYQPLQDFITEQHFPAGSFHLRLFRWKDSNFFNIFTSSKDYKIETIQSLINCCLERRFILIGDSGEHDPEIYASIARQYPQQVQHIFIHDVTEEGKNAKRYQKTFKGLPLSLWTVFRDATRLNIR